MIKNEYSKLKSCIVGREFEFSKQTADVSFKAFFAKNLDELDYEPAFQGQYTKQIIDNRNKDLDNLAKVIESFGVKVYRPKNVTTLIPVKTPTFKSFYRSSSNVRDQCLIYKNTIYETPPVYAVGGLKILAFMIFSMNFIATV